MIVINYFGAPGAGKSTGAALTFSELKRHGVSVELVTEFAKDKVYEETTEVWNHQQYIFGKQSFRLGRLKNKVDVVVTDSPLILSALYNNDPLLGEPFNQVVRNVFNSYTNVNYFVNRVKPYNPKGRHQTAEESDALAIEFKEKIAEYGIYFENIDGAFYDYKEVVAQTLEYLGMEYEEC